MIMLVALRQGEAREVRADAMDALVHEEAESDAQRSPDQIFKAGLPLWSMRKPNPMRNEALTKYLKRA
jgi:hypothetical protein